MQLGMIGLGRMGANMVRRLMRWGHQCVVFDVDRTPVPFNIGVGYGLTPTADRWTVKAIFDIPMPQFAR